MLTARRGHRATTPVSPSSSPAAFIDFLADAYGPLLGARHKLSGDGRWEPLRNELIALSNEMNTSDDGRFWPPANTSS